MIDFKALAAPFPPEVISWRVGSMTKDKKKGMALAYIDARVVMERLDAVCGPDGWQDKYSHANGKTVCDIAIWCGPERGWVWKADGAGDSDIEAEKGALSDAFKRAAVRWGIGRDLYEMPTPWVELDEWKKIVPQELKRLDQVARQHGSSNAPPAPAAQPSSANGRRMAAEEPHLIDKTRQKGTVAPQATGQTTAERRAEKIKAGVEKRISALKSVTGWTRPTLDQFWADNKDWIDWMADPANEALKEYERFSTAFADAEVNMRETA